MASETTANMTNSFGARAEQLYSQIFLKHLVATTFGKYAPKYSVGHKSCSLKYGVKFQQEC